MFALKPTQDHRARKIAQATNWYTFENRYVQEQTARIRLEYYTQQRE